MTTTFRVVDLFAGCGGLTQGFQDVARDKKLGVRYEVVAAVEADRAAAATYAANFGRDHLHHLKIEDWRTEDIPAAAADGTPGADVVVGGPPCQGFSNLGRRDPGDPRNQLWREYVRVLDLIKPYYFVMENVAAFFRSPEWEIFQEELESGALQDYEADAYVLNAAEFGVPQVRKRAIVIGRRKDRRPVPAPVGRFAGRPEKWKTVEDALDGRLEPQVPTDAINLPDDLFPFDDASLPGAFKTSELHLTRNLTELSRLRFADIPYGGNRTDIHPSRLARCWVGHTSGSMDVMGRLVWEKPSVTIRTEFVKPEKGRYLHPDENRPITHAEAALLQTFPTDFLWCGSKVQIAKQIGNAVPVKLANELGKLIARELLNPVSASVERAPRRTATSKRKAV